MLHFLALAVPPLLLLSVIVYLEWDTDVGAKPQ